MPKLSHSHTKQIKINLKYIWSPTHQYESQLRSKLSRTWKQSRQSSVGEREKSKHRHAYERHILVLWDSLLYSSGLSGNHYFCSLGMAASCLKQPISLFSMPNAWKYRPEPWPAQEYYLMLKTNALPITRRYWGTSNRHRHLSKRAS